MDIVNLAVVPALILLAVANNRIIAYFVTPLFVRFEWDKTLILYISGVTGFVLGMLSQLQLFSADLFIHPLVDKIILALLIGGGANLIHDILDKPAPVSYTAYVDDYVYPSEHCSCTEDKEDTSGDR